MELRTITVVLGICVCLWQNILSTVYGNAVFPVEHKFKGKDWSLLDLVEHDAHRHGRMLDTVDFPLGGNANPSVAGLYYTKLKIGTPGTDYHVQVDTGSDVLWINCAGCDKCPTKSSIGIPLNFFDPKASSTSESVGCRDDACAMVYSGVLNGCKPDMPCFYEIKYGDESTTSGKFVQDVLHYAEAAGNQTSSSGNGTIVFGCGALQTGGLSENNQATDGIMGFGQANSSVISQLAAAKKVKNVFSHCLDGIDGGGIFAIGELVEPKISMTPYVPNQSHYNVMMTDMTIGDEVIDLSADGIAAIIDCGTTLAYMPDSIYQSFMSAMEKKQPDLEIEVVKDQYKCFEFDDNVDKAFPVIKLEFTKSLTFTVHPSEYLFQYREGMWCIGWMTNGIQVNDGKDLFLLGDMVLANKLVVYDLENQTIGWSEYNCSSSIKLKDGVKGPVEPVDAHDISAPNPSSGFTSLSGLSLTILVVLISTTIQFIHYR